MPSPECRCSGFSHTRRPVIKSRLSISRRNRLTTVTDSEDQLRQYANESYVNVVSPETSGRLSCAQPSRGVGPAEPPWVRNLRLPLCASLQIRMASTLGRDSVK